MMVLEGFSCFSAAQKDCILGSLFTIWRMAHV